MVSSFSSLVDTQLQGEYPHKNYDILAHQAANLYPHLDLPKQWDWLQQMQLYFLVN